MRLARAVVLVALLAPAALAAVPEGAWTHASVAPYPNCTPAFRGVAYASPVSAVAVGNCASIYTTLDGGATWKRYLGSGELGNYQSAHFANPLVGMVSGANAIMQPSVYVTVNGGATWTWHGFYIEDHFGVGNEGVLFDVRMLTPTVAHAAAGIWDGDGAIVTTLDGGLTWVTTDWFEDRLIGLDFVGAHGIAVGQRGIVAVTSDGGLTWTEPARPTSSHLWDVDVVSLTEAWAVGDDGTVLMSADGGLTWTPVATGDARAHRAVAVTGIDEVRVGGDAGVLLTTDGGATWVRESGPDVGRVQALAFPVTPTGGLAVGSSFILRHQAPSPLPEVLDP